MKKVIVISLLLILIILFVSCAENEEDNPHGEVISCYDHLERFEDFDSFAKYASNPETQTEYSKIDPKAPVDLGSIIPNEEIYAISSFNNRYQVYYKQGDGQVGALSFMMYVYYDEDSTVWESEETIFCEDKVENVDVLTNTGYYKFSVNGTDVYYDAPRKFYVDSIRFRIGNHGFELYNVTASLIDGHTEAQFAFCEAFFTEQGTADMLERIKALLPQE